MSKSIGDYCEKGKHMGNGTKPLRRLEQETVLNETHRCLVDPRRFWILGSFSASVRGSADSNTNEGWTLTLRSTVRALESESTRK